MRGPAEERASVGGAGVVSAAILAPADWDAALEAAARPVRFSHRSAAGVALERAYPEYRYEPHELHFEDGTHALLPVVRVERRLEDLTLRLAMPLEWEGTPVVLDGTLDAEKVRATFEALGGRGMLRIVGGAGGNPPDVGAGPAWSTHVLELEPGYEDLWASAFTGKNRNSCRKARKSGVEVAREGRGAASGYYELYARASRGWGHDEPPYPAALFSALEESGYADFWLARIGGRAVAGAVILLGSDDVFYWSGAMDREHQSAAPSNELLRAVVEWACEAGHRYMDFGASEGLPGVRRFKESFGARPLPVATAELGGLRHRALEGLLDVTRRVRPSGREP